MQVYCMDAPGGRPPHFQKHYVLQFKLTFTLNEVGAHKICS